MLSLKKEEYNEIYDVLLAKIHLPVEADADPDNLEDNYILFECHFMGKYIKYYPEMFINICHNFLAADT